MRVKVIKGFRDKHTGEIRKVGSVFSCDDNRYGEISKHVVVVKEEKEVKEIKANDGK